MLDQPMRRVLRAPLEGGARRLAAVGVSAATVTGLGFTAGVAACVAVAFGWWWVGLVLWLVNRVADGLDGPVARIRGADDAGGFVDIVADFSVYGGFVVGVAVAVPSARLACVVLLCTYYVSGTSLLARSSLAERRGATAEDRSLHFVGGLAEGSETIIAYIAFCLLPGHATVIAWVFASMVAVTALQRVTGAIRLLRLPVDG